jgi:hypothetical protein
MQMRWYVSRNGETQGPIDEATVAQWVRAGMRDASVRDDAGGNWTPIAQSPFAALAARPQKSQSTLGILGAVGGGLLIAVFGVRIFVFGSPSTPQVVVQGPAIAPVAVPAVVAPTPKLPDMQQEKARYEHDRDLVRKSQPKTEDEIVKLLGRKPDDILQTPQMTMLQWYYASKAEGRDVLQVAIQNGKITIMSL